MHIEPISTPNTILKHLQAGWDGRAGIVDGSARSASTLVRELLAVGASIGAVVIRGHNDSLMWCANPVGDSLETVSTHQDELQGWIDRMDPERRWSVVSSRTDEVECWGRRVYGRRLPSWVILEDKTLVDDLWRTVGVPHPQSLVVPMSTPCVERAARTVDAGRGVVIAKDASHGVTSSGHGLRWVQDDLGIRRAIAAFQGSATRVRVAEFIDGTPCSVLACVMDDGTAVFDPIEVVTLCDPTSDLLQFCGTSTFWRPPPESATEMRSLAMRVGEHLRAEYEYRGIFSIDGVLGGGRFLATELNPRHASGLGIRAAWPDCPMYLFDRSLREQTPHLGLAAVDLERSVRSAILGRPSFALSAAGYGASRNREQILTSVRTLSGELLKVSFSLVGGSLRIDRADWSPRTAPIAALVSAVAHETGSSLIEPRMRRSRSPSGPSLKSQGW